MHATGKLGCGKRSFSCDFRDVEVTEIQSVFAVVWFNQAPRPPAKLATSVCVDP